MKMLQAYILGIVNPRKSFEENYSILKFGFIDVLSLSIKLKIKRFMKKFK